MGGFYDSIHVRTESYHLIRDILTELAKSKGHKFYLAPVVNGWISIYPNNYCDESLAREISSHIEEDVLHMTVHDDDIFRYLYYRKSELIDEYNSCPDYFGERVSAKEKGRLKGNPEVFRELVGSEDKVKKLRKLLKPKSILGSLKISKEARHKIKKMEEEMKASSKAIKDMINDQGAVLEFLEKNPGLFKDEMASLAKKAVDQGLKSTEEVQKFLLEDENAQQINMKIVEAYIKSRMSSKEYNFFKPLSDKWNKTFADIEKQISDQMFVDEKGEVKVPKGLFASETMFKFAELFGIPNAVTSYEYLKAGETEDIKEWEKFVEIA